MTKIKAGVIGYPIKHSLSPIIHNFWLNQYGIDGSYERIEVKPEDLDDFLENGIKEYAGVNVTIPHKVEVFKKVKVGEKFQRITNIIGAANTIVNNNGIIECFNTDSSGFIKNYHISFDPNEDNNYHSKKYQRENSLVIGAGGAANAICYSLLSSTGDFGVKNLYITNRTKEKAEKLSNLCKKNFPDANIKVIDWEDKDNHLSDIDLLVNTSSLGMTGQPELEINISSLKKSAVVTDIVYNPLETKLLRDAKNQGNRTVDGLGMLLYQAAPGFASWFGVKPEVTPELREHVIKELGLK